MGHVGAEPAGAEIRLTAAGRKQLEREIAGFERLLAGISRVIRPVES